MIKTAHISGCGAYRYQLGRRWDDGPVMLWVMLNPSTADADNDDPTIRRCIGFAKAWGYGAIYVGNLFALRATDPQELARHDAPDGPDNWRHIHEMKKDCGLIMAAWGAHPFVDKYLAGHQMRRLNRTVHCLGLTKSEAPKHPLYVPGNTTPVVFLKAAVSL